MGADHMMQNGLAALQDAPRLGADHVAAAPPASVAPVPQLAALGDTPASASSQDSPVESTGGIVSESPTEQPRLAASSPHGFLDLAKQYYAAANATGEGEFEAEADDGRKEDNCCKTRQAAATAWTR